MSVFCHGQRRAWISIPLSTSGTCWIGGWGQGPFPPAMSGNLQVPWWKSGVTSHNKNCQIWYSPREDDALQYLMQLLATPDTDCYFWFWPPLCSGTHYSISVSHMSVELVQFMSQLLNLVMFIQIFAG
jgi:aryl-phospho-beta-D-glucosidase BglC (GH1 family)